MAPTASFSAIFLVLGILLSALSQALSRDVAPDFNREVRPILSAHCFECHGPDADHRKAGFRLDDPTEADRRLILAADGEPSLVMERILHEDPEERMPPPAAKNPLSPEKQAILRRWVEHGAVYEPHWAFLSPQLQAPPAAFSREEPARHPLDAFVLARLHAEGLTLEPAAERYTLARRLSLSLVGFPPTPEEARAFQEAAHPDAESRWIDRLLASPAYGERWARRWLDLARYADTNGYEKDRPRSIWPYRDWVIDALNAGQPFDQFTIEQLAGDLLPEATLAQHVATGFHRNTMVNEEGGIDPQEYRFHALVDRVNTTSTVWLGLTMACAQCHTHKYDPLLHQDYYAMMAYLNNAEEPDLSLPDPTITERREALQAQIDQQRQELPQQFPDPDAFPRQLESWFASMSEKVAPWEVLSVSSSDANLSKLEPLEDGSLLAQGDQTKRDVYQLHFKGAWQGVTAVRLEALPHDSLPRSGPGRAYYEGPKGDFFLSEIQLLQNGTPLSFRSASESYAKLGIGGGKGTAAEAIDGNEVTGWSTSGGEGRPHQAVFLLDQPLQDTSPIEIRLVFNRHYPATLGRFRLSVTRDRDEAKLRALPFSTADETVFRRPWQALSEAERQRVTALFCEETPLLKEAREALETLERQLPSYPTTLVFRERPDDHPRTTRRHHRGEFLQPKEPVAASLPGLFASTLKEPPSDRLEFARWLVSEQNPLAARVQINRDWSAFFGQGLVGTTEDFGSQGSPPSHPGLLDWLAVDFMQSGWSRKRMHRSLLNSAVYLQASRLSPSKRAKDPENVLLSRGPRFRIEAELMRDSALRMAGTLTQKVGGASVFPPQPANVTTEGTYGRLNWKVSEGEDRFRRGLYTFSKRTAPYAMFTTFDAGSGEACLARREVTNTPLQALTALNDGVFFETAQILGRSITRLSQSQEEKTQTLFWQILTRPPAPEEQRWMAGFVKKLREQLQAKPQQAQALMQADETGEEVIEQAQWTLLARALMNLDETFLHR